MEITLVIIVILFIGRPLLFWLMPLDKSEIAVKDMDNILRRTSWKNFSKMITEYFKTLGKGR
jgi:hypothetical protein